MKKVFYSLIKRGVKLILTPFVFVVCVIFFQYSFLNKWLWFLKHDYLNPWQTFLFNFSAFPFKIAVKMPVFVYEKLDFCNMGKIIIDSDCIEPGMVKINCLNKRKQATTKILNYGTIKFQKDVRIFGGANLTVLTGGVFFMKQGSLLGDNTIIVVENSIELGVRSTITYGSVMTDTNSHFTITMDGKTISKLNAPIVIGDYNWICNNASIKAGTKTPHHMIAAASYSVLTKDYTKSVAPYSIIGGCPAKLLKEGVARIFDVDYEKKIVEMMKSGDFESSLSEEDIERMTTSLNNYK